MAKVFDVPVDGPPVERMPGLDQEYFLSGVRTLALPPGELEINYKSNRHIVDVNLNPVRHEIAINSDRMDAVEIPRDSFAWIAPGTEYRMQCRNEMWGALIEIDPARAVEIETEMLDGRELPPEYRDYQADQGIANLGRLLISHLNGERPDPLYTESLGLAIAARGIMQSNGVTDLAPAVQEDVRIARALDFIEEHFSDTLSVGELSSVAGMSAGHFARSFKKTIGEAVWSYVRRRRCERAKELVLYTTLPLADIAYRSGFGNQGHMTSCFREFFGVTPGQMRN